MNLFDRIENTNFKWVEFLWLPKWQIHCYPNQEVLDNVKVTAKKLQMIRDHYDKRVYVLSGVRPDLYNQLIGGAVNSGHKIGKAVDFYVDTVSCDQVRKDIEPKLEEWDIRMENEPGIAKVHIDWCPVVFNRYFKPVR